MVPPEIAEAREETCAAHAAYLAAVRAYTGAVLRHADPAVQRDLVIACRRSADAYDTSLLVLADRLAALPPGPTRAAALTEVRRLQRTLRLGRRVLPRPG